MHPDRLSPVDPGLTAGDHRPPVPMVRYPLSRTSARQGSVRAAGTGRHHHRLDNARGSRVAPAPAGRIGFEGGGLSGPRRRITIHPGRVRAYGSGERLHRKLRRHVARGQGRRTAHHRRARRDTHSCGLAQPRPHVHAAARGPASPADRRRRRRILGFQRQGTRRKRRADGFQLLEPLDERLHAGRTGNCLRRAGFHHNG